MLDILAEIYDDGGRLVRVRYALFDGDLRFVTAVELQFESRSAVFRAVAYDDTLAASLGELKPELYETLVEVNDSEQWSNCIGCGVCWAWQLTNQQGYLDGVRLEFSEPGGVGRAVIELIVVASAKHLMPFKRRRELRNWLIAREIAPNTLSGIPTSEEWELAQYLEFREGDYISMKLEQSFHVYKLLKIWPRNHTFHCMRFEALSSQPQKADIPSLKVAAWHAPIYNRPFNERGIYIGYRPVTQEEMRGYMTYLSITGLDEVDFIGRTREF